MSPSASRALLRVATAVALAGRAPSLAAQPAAPAPRPRPDTARTRVVDTVRVIGRIDDLVGSASTASEGRVGAADLRARPIAREGELLEAVPGMIVTQHSGDGKANQYFVRGFNLDHGTDFQTRVEGMPLNMPTHGHGQGYTDLNPLVPELVDHLEYRLGVYHAELGDFGSAGGAEFRLVRVLDRPFATLETGQYGLARLAAGGSRALGRGTLLLGGEAKAYDGPWEQGQGLRKYSGVARYTLERGASRLSVLGMAYRNRWNATDQLPRRAVAQGLVSRFGQLDSTDGGSAARYSLSASWRRLGARSVQEVQVYGVHSDLDLFSNFAFFLDDPSRGDQFAQWDRRTVVGTNATHTRAGTATGVEHQVKVGVQSRADFIGGVGLARTVAREVVETVRADRVRQVGAGVFVEAESRWRPWVRTVLGARADGYAFHVRSDRAENSGDRTAGIVSPKASLILTPSRTTELYVSGGWGFHSNDARGTTITVDPATGAPASRVDPLVRSRGAEVGLRASPARGLRSTVSLWMLGLDSELLFVGDAGATEPSAGSRRGGVTLANFWRPTAALSVDADVSLARARFRGLGAGASFIPGALENVLAGGVTWLPSNDGGGAFGALRLRRFGSYPLIEDNGARARASTLLNADVGYLLRSGLRLQLTVLNLANSRADDIQYYYPSRLPGEAAEGEADVHFHPAEPRQVRASVGWRF